MKQEVEVKVLNVNVDGLKKILLQKGGRNIGIYRLAVDWYRPIGQKFGEENWYLRIRTYSDGRSEMTWKGKSKKGQNSRADNEINIDLSEPESFSELLCKIGLEKYAHQEKDRQSWVLGDLKIDIDTYPKMPTYAEIEGKSDEDIAKAIKLLKLENHEKSTEGERILIMEKYNLNWLDMRF